MLPLMVVRIRGRGAWTNVGEQRIQRVVCIDDEFRFRERPSLRVRLRSALAVVRVREDACASDCELPVALLCGPVGVWATMRLAH